MQQIQKRRKHERSEAVDGMLMVCPGWVQEVTPESFEMMRRSPWWNRYMASPTCENQSYDTAILFSKSQVAAAGPFERHNFRNSRMGEPLVRCCSLRGLSAHAPHNQANCKPHVIMHWQLKRIGTLSAARPSNVGTASAREAESMPT